MQFLLDKADDLENCLGRNYLFFEGIPKQGTNETWDQPEPKIKQLISDKLEWNAAGVPIERAHRLGPEKQDKPWPIITKFLHFKDREKVLNFPIIGISQTWLTSNLDGVHVDGYSFHHECRADKHGGGVGIFVNSSIKHTPRDNLRVNVSKKSNKHHNFPATLKKSIPLIFCLGQG